MLYAPCVGQGGAAHAVGRPLKASGESWGRPRRPVRRAKSDGLPLGPPVTPGPAPWAREQGFLEWLQGRVVPRGGVCG